MDSTSRVAIVRIRDRELSQSASEKAYNMPQLQNLVLTDRAATPVAHTMAPRSKEGGVAVVAESTGVPIGDPKYTIASTRTAGGRYKVTIKFVVPVVQTQTINGVSTPVVVRTAYVDTTFSFDASSSEAERNNVVGMFADSFAPAKLLVNDTVVKLQGIW